MTTAQKTFTASYSGGKDSALALCRAVRQGHRPLSRITTYNTDRARSWFHGIPEAVLADISEVTDIPVWLIKTSGEAYAQSFEETLLRARGMGAHACVFGDIGIEAHRVWCEERCRSVGIEAMFPLWGEDRQAVVYDFIDSGFTAHITTHASVILKGESNSMIYKPFGNTGRQVSALGFGAMRLPMIDSGEKKYVDKEKSAQALLRAVELGVNYFDTAPYYCESDSETALGMALKGVREQVYIATKYPLEDASGDQCRKRLETSLARLQTDTIDFYHMWSVSLDTFRTIADVPNGPIVAALKAKDEGLIRHLSFSFHDAPENMRPIIDSGYFDSVLMQYNLLDRSNEGNLRYAKEKGLGTVVMGPVGGGRLGEPSSVIRGLIGREIASSAEMALRFVLASPYVDVALSGMENVSMVEENVRVASIKGTLSPEELAVVEKMLAENARLSELYCTGCKYCMPCPQGINIPHVFALMNDHRVYNLTAYAKAKYNGLRIPLADRPGFDKPNGLDASVCVACGQCESKCPQKLKIVEQLRETDRALG